MEAASDRVQRSLEEATTALRARAGPLIPARLLQARPDGGASAPADPPPGGGGPFAALREACRPEFAAVGRCGDDAECAHAHMGLVLCMAKQVCEAEAAAFEKALHAEGGSAEARRARAFEDMQGCLSKYATASRARGAAEA